MGLPSQVTKGQAAPLAFLGMPALWWSLLRMLLSEGSPHTLDPTGRPCGVPSGTKPLVTSYSTCLSLPCPSDRFSFHPPSLAPCNAGLLSGPQTRQVRSCLRAFAQSHSLSGSFVPTSLKCKSPTPACTTPFLTYFPLEFLLPAKH